MKRTSYSLAKTVGKAFGLLEALAAKQPARPPELAAQLTISRSNVHRLLATLEQLGYVEKTEGSTYRLTAKIYVLGNSEPLQKKLSEAARPYMTRLAEMSQENVNLAVPYGKKVLYIDKIVSPHYLKLDQPIGQTDPLHCTALGKALLSGMTESEFTEFCQSTELKQYTKRTITNRDALWKVLVKTRKRGYATDLGELREGIHCIGSPIHDSANKVIAAISISAPAIRLTKERMKKLEAPLVEVAREISRKMGLSLLSKRNSLVLRRGER